MFFIDSFREKGRVRGRERERMRLVASHMAGLGIEPAAKVCALTRNQTHNLLVYGMGLRSNQPSNPARTLYLLLK